MSRRGKKRSALSLRKPSLHFTESPVQVQNNPVSPVLGADNPVTAKSVLLEDYSDISWISPNFKEIRNRYQMTGCRRNLRPRKAGISATQRPVTSTKLRNQSGNKENNSITGKTIRNNRGKLKPLIFLQDKQEELESELHSISEHNGSTPGMRPTQDESFNEDNDVSFHTPVLNANRISSRLCGVNVAVGDCNVDHLKCLCNSPITRRSLTQKNTANHCPIHQQLNNSPIHQQLNNSPIHQQLNNSPSTQNTSTPRNQQCSDVMDSFLDTDDCASPRSRDLRRSSRLRKKYLEAVKLFQSLSPKDTGRALKVLAEDTPENEYHLNMKRRQLRKIVASL